MSWLSDSAFGKGLNRVMDPLDILGFRKNAAQEQQKKDDASINEQMKKEADEQKKQQSEQVKEYSKILMYLLLAFLLYKVIEKITTKQ